MKNTKVKELMTSPVKTVAPLDIMMVVSDIFQVHDFHHIPVVDEGGYLVGMVSKQDYHTMLSSLTIYKTNWAAIDNARFKKAVVVKDVMTKSVVKLTLEDTLQKAVSIFKENRFHALPIVDDHNRVIGILTTYDLLNYAYPG